MHGKSLVSNKWTLLERKTGRTDAGGGDRALDLLISHKRTDCRDLTAGIFYKTAKHQVTSRSVWALNGHSNTNMGHEWEFSHVNMGHEWAFSHANMGHEWVLTC